MENVLFTRSSAPSNEPIVDGQLIFDTSGTGKMYLDNGTDRLEMGGAMNVDSTLSKTSTNPIQNKAVAGVMLENLTDIDTVTASGFLTDALATKELHTEVNEINSNLSNINVYVGKDDGKLHFVDSEGADSVLPFSTGISEIYLSAYSHWYNSTYTTASLWGDGKAKYDGYMILIVATYGNSGANADSWAISCNGTDASLSYETNTDTNAYRIAFVKCSAGDSIGYSGAGRCDHFGAAINVKL